MQKKKTYVQYRYLDILTALFVAILLISNIASSKISAFGWFTLDAGTIIFPLSYIFGDIMTEVYGYSRARRVIWIGFLCNILMAIIFAIVGALPSATDWNHQDAYNTILGMTPRIVFASMVAYFAGEFLNSFILAKMKVWSKGKYLWQRTIGSTLVGEFFDTLLFITIAFMGIVPMPILVALLISNYIFKVAVEVLLTPVTYQIVRFLKKSEHEDYYDYDTNFNPFDLSLAETKK